MASGVVKVRRDGPRGWHWIDASRYDPAVHVLADAAQDQPAPQAAEASLPVDGTAVPAEPRKRGRPRKVA